MQFKPFQARSSVSRTMGRNAHLAAKRLRIVAQLGRASAVLLSRVT